jgi:iron complex outermembrane receptor protein
MLIAANYSLSRFAVNLNNQRFGTATLLDATNPDLDQTVRAKWITDLAVSYELQRRLDVGVSVNNLFDVYPDQWRDFDRGKGGVLSLGGVFRYPGALSPFGMDGRTIYVHMSYR